MYVCVYSLMLSHHVLIRDECVNSDVVASFQKIVGGTIEHAPALFLAFGFVIAADGLATLTHRVADWDGLCNDLNRSIAAAGLVEV
jgi:hypothetical protein